LLKFNWKKIAKPHAEQLYAHNQSFSEFLIQEKLTLFFLYGQLLQSGASLLGLTKSIYYQNVVRTN